VAGENGKWCVRTEFALKTVQMKCKILHHCFRQVRMLATDMESFVFGCTVLGSLGSSS